MIQDISTNEFVSGIANDRYDENDIVKYCSTLSNIKAFHGALIVEQSRMMMSNAPIVSFSADAVLMNDIDTISPENELKIDRLARAISIVEDLMQGNQEKAASDERPPLTAQHNSGRRKGRPTKPFKAIMLNDEDGEHLKKIHAMMNGKSGKDAALIMLVCIKKGWITRPTFAQVEKEFGDIGSKQDFSKYLNESRFAQYEIEGAINSLD
jgi:hypothetical protein